jgi:dihydroorotase-like cyclic amidohydrolase
VSFEVFLGDLAPPLLVTDDGVLRHILARIADVGSIAGVTPTDGAILRAELERIHAEGRRDPLAFARSRPPIAEALGVARACLLASDVGARVHLRQVSCRASIAVLRAARAGYRGISAETMPHNLLLHEDELQRQGPFAKVAPPLRSPADAEALWEALLDGTGGFPGLQTWLPLMLDQVAKGRWTLVDLIRCCAEAPARLFGLYPRKGALEPGSDADLVIVDPARTITIDNNSQLSRARVTPFAGRVVTGIPVLTMVRGQVVMRDGALTGTPRGALVTPVRPRS